MATVPRRRTATVASGTTRQMQNRPAAKPPVRGTWDMTLRNLRATKKRLAALEARVAALEARWATAT